MLVRFDQTSSLGMYRKLSMLTRGEETSGGWSDLESLIDPKKNLSRALGKGLGLGYQSPGILNEGGVAHYPHILEQGSPIYE